MKTDDDKCPKCGNFSRKRTLIGVECANCGATIIPLKIRVEQPVYNIGRGTSGRRKKGGGDEMPEVWLGK